MLLHFEITGKVFESERRTIVVASGGSYRFPTLCSISKIWRVKGDW